MRTALRTTLRPMTADDIVQVADVERESFPSMWPQTAYKRELANKLARYLVLTEQRNSTIDPPATNGLWGTLRRIVGSEPAVGPHEYLLGFIGLWLMVGEAHIVTVAVRERYRRMGIGERLVIAALDLAIEAEQDEATLEVRASNDPAQRLYEKYGFVRLGLRKRYYTDNNEDAVIMTTPGLSSDVFRARLEELRKLHQAEHPDLWH
jgi:ribosomal-protein-alanine N-acetyltransferase